jgi:hypothetical protein
MKSSGSLVAGAVLPEYYAHHANDDVKTTQAYEAHALQVNYVSLNNEPTCCPSINYPSILLITSSQMATMLKGLLVPGLQGEPSHQQNPAARLQLGKRRFDRTVVEGRSHPDLTICGRRCLAWVWWRPSGAVANARPIRSRRILHRTLGLRRWQPPATAGYARSGERDPQLGEVLCEVACGRG